MVSEAFPGLVATDLRNSEAARTVGTAVHIVADIVVDTAARIVVGTAVGNRLSMVELPRRLARKMHPEHRHNKHRIRAS